MHDVIVIGSGPAGYTAAIYLARAELNPLVFEGYVVRRAPDDHHRGGELPRLPGRHPGPRTDGQHARAGRAVRRRPAMEDVESVSLTGAIKSVTVAGVQSPGPGGRAGHRFRRPLPDLPDEQAARAAACRACATCDGFFFRDQDIAVVGGGDSAMEEATFLTRFARTRHRRAPPRGLPGPHHAGPGPGNDKIRLATTPTVSASGRQHVTGLRSPTPSPVRNRTLPATGCSWPSATTPARSCSGSRRTDDEGYVLGRGRGHRHRQSTACSPAATWSTTPTARRSPRRARAARRRSTPNAGWPTLTTPPPPR